MDKENKVEYLNKHSRIPVPTGHLLVQTKKRGTSRPPLRTIQNKSSPKAGPSKSLKYNEDQGHAREPSAINPPSDDTKFNRDYIIENFEYLLNKEAKCINVNPLIIKRARLINWLMRVNGPHGDPSVVQTACTYLDTYLGMCKYRPQSLDLHTVTAACYWIAQKQIEPPIPAADLVKCAYSKVTIKNLVKAERSIFKKLGFPLQPVVPQDYISYLCWCCDSSNGEELEVAATLICMCGLMVAQEYCQEYPSVIASAAVKTALNVLKKDCFLPRLEACDIFRAALLRSKNNLKKATELLRRAAQKVCSPGYEFRTPLEHYETPQVFSWFKP